MTDYTELVARLSEMCCNIDDEAAAAIEQLSTEREALREALDYIGSRVYNELPYYKPGSDEEVVLRLIAKRAFDVLGEQEEKP